ncbi:protein EMSY-LIKE 1 [Eutrema salsugineum]|uniref:protein EMSY-LIKE 1 n=1 Tax=Eutrema salsugineum TaxID=72664 RepID=UPI000CED2C19|nr:protein EMSY-LIKE 1 [Eutrema salsugineum]
MSSNSNSDDFFFHMSKKNNLYELQRQAYYDVLYAFAAESSAISSPGITIIKELKKEWNITYKIHNFFQEEIKADPLVQKLRRISLASDDKEKQKVAAAEEQKTTAVQGTKLKPRLILKNDDLLQLLEKLNVAPTKMPKEKAKPSSFPDDSTILSWGQVSPASLVNRWINIRMPGESDYTSFLIEEYNPKTEMHYLVTAPSKNDLVDLDPCNWIDIRHFPAEDVVWDEEHPGFPSRKGFLKPGETILHATSTAREKKQLKEVGKTASGIPIIMRKLDKGKSICT